jgi:hypothetical protein
MTSPRCRKWFPPKNSASITYSKTIQTVIEASARIVPPPSILQDKIRAFRPAGHYARAVTVAPSACRETNQRTFGCRERVQVLVILRPPFLLEALSVDTFTIVPGPRKFDRRAAPHSWERRGEDWGYVPTKPARGGCHAGDSGSRSLGQWRRHPVGRRLVSHRPYALRCPRGAPPLHHSAWRSESPARLRPLSGSRFASQLACRSRCYQVRLTQAFSAMALSQRDFMRRAVPLQARR